MTETLTAPRPNPNTAPAPSTAAEAMAADIGAAADFTYAATASERRVSPEEAHKLAVCQTAAELMVGAMEDMGYQARVESRRVWSARQGHNYPVIDAGKGRKNEVIADPTWQQFLLDPPEDAPRVLVGTRREVIEQAKAYGVDSRTAKVWAPRWRDRLRMR